MWNVRDRWFLMADFGIFANMSTIWDTVEISSETSWGYWGLFLRRNIGQVGNYKKSQIVFFLFHCWDIKEFLFPNNKKHSPIASDRSVFTTDVYFFYVILPKTHAWTTESLLRFLPSKTLKGVVPLLSNLCRPACIVKSTIGKKCNWI